MKIRIGSRGSKLAVTQAEWIGSELLKKNPTLQITFHQIRTRGDSDAHSSLSIIGGKGVFVKEIEEALLKSEIDLAVHSLKDVPQMLPSGLELGPFPLREDPRDAVLTRFGELLHELPKRSSIGTGSPRRLSQLKNLFGKKYKVEPIRGNVETRVKKLQNGEFDAIILAVAGLKRLGLEKEIIETLEPDVFMPAPGQGCLGLELRSEDQPLLDLLKTISDRSSDSIARAERAFLQGLGGSCLLPVAGYAVIDGEDLEMKAKIFDSTGERKVEAQFKGDTKTPELVGSQLAEKILHVGGHEILMNLPDAVET